MGAEQKKAALISCCWCLELGPSQGLYKHILWEKGRVWIAFIVYFLGDFFFLPEFVHSSQESVCSEITLYRMCFAECFRNF